MNALVICALVAATVLVVRWAALAATVRTARWPTREPEHVDDDRSHDHRLAELARQLGAPNLAEVHRSVVELAQRLSADGRVHDSRLAAFLDDPPLSRPDRYRRELDVALTRMEML